MLIEMSTATRSAFYHPAVALGLAIFLFFCNFIFALDSYKAFISLTIVVLIINFIRDEFDLETLRLPHAYWILLASALTLITLSVLPLEGHHPKNRMLLNVGFLTILCAAINWFLNNASKAQILWTQWMIVAALSGGLLTHWLVQAYFHRPYGLFENPHFVAFFTLFCIPVLICFINASRHYSIKFLLGSLLIIAFYLLAISGSRPAWLAIISSYVLGSCLFLSPKKRWLSLSAVGIVSVLFIFIFPELVGERLANLFVEFWKEERFIVWRDSLMMLQESAWHHWIIGHGIGSFKYYFSVYSTYQITFIFPHNFILEILFDSGLVGLSIVSYLYGVLYYRLIIMGRSGNDHNFSIIYTLFVLQTAYLIFTFFTLPFYSRYVILLQAPVISLTLYLHEQYRPAPGR